MLFLFSFFIAKKSLQKNQKQNAEKELNMKKMGREKH